MVPHGMGERHCWSCGVACVGPLVLVSRGEAGRAVGLEEQFHVRAHDVLVIHCTVFRQPRCAAARTMLLSGSPHASAHTAQPLCLNASQSIPLASNKPLVGCGGLKNSPPVAMGIEIRQKACFYKGDVDTKDTNITKFSSFSKKVHTWAFHIDQTAQPQLKTD